MIIVKLNVDKVRFDFLWMHYFSWMKEIIVLAISNLADCDQTVLTGMPFYVELYRMTNILLILMFYNIPPP